MEHYPVLFDILCIFKGLVAKLTLFTELSIFTSEIIWKSSTTFEILSNSPQLLMFYVSFPLQYDASFSCSLYFTKIKLNSPFSLALTFLYRYQN